MFHWCGEETAMVAGLFSSVGLCWAWMKHKVRGWRERREQRAMEKARKRYGWGTVTQQEFLDIINAPPKPMTDMEKVAALMKGKPL